MTPQEQLIWLQSLPSQIERIESNSNGANEINSIVQRLRTFVRSYDWRADTIAIDRGHVRPSSLSVPIPPHLRPMNSNFAHHSAIASALEHLHQLIPDLHLQAPKSQQRYFDRRGRLVIEPNGPLESCIARLRATSVATAAPSSNPGAFVSSWIQFVDVPHLDALTPAALAIHSKRAHRLLGRRKREVDIDIDEMDEHDTRNTRQKLDDEQKQASSMDDEIMILSQAPQPIGRATRLNELMNDGINYSSSCSSGSSSRRSSFDAEFMEQWSNDQELPQFEELDTDEDELMSCTQLAQQARRDGEDVTMMDAATVPQQEVAAAPIDSDGANRLPAPAAASVTAPSEAVPVSVATSSSTASSSTFTSLLEMLPYVRSMLLSRLSAGPVFQSIDQTAQMQLTANASTIPTPATILTALKAHTKLKSVLPLLRQLFEFVQQWRELPASQEFDSVCERMELHSLTQPATFVLLLAFLDVHTSGALVRSVLEQTLLPLMRGFKDSTPAGQSAFMKLIAFVIRSQEENMIASVLRPWVEGLVAGASSSPDTKAQQSLLQVLLSPQGAVHLSPRGVVIVLHHMFTTLLRNHERLLSGPFDLPDWMIALLANKVFTHSSVPQLPPPQATNIDALLVSAQKGTRDWTTVVHSGGEDSTAALLACILLAVSTGSGSVDTRITKLLGIYVERHVDTHAISHHVNRRQLLITLASKIGESASSIAQRLREIA